MNPKGFPVKIGIGTKKHNSRKLECASFKMGYRGLPVRKHSIWDPFRRPRGLDFRVCDFTDFLALKTKLFTGPKFTAARAWRGPP